MGDPTNLLAIFLPNTVDTKRNFFLNSGLNIHFSRWDWQTVKKDLIYIQGCMFVKLLIFDFMEAFLFRLCFQEIE